MVDGAAVHHLIGDELVLLVEEEDAELLARLVGQSHPHVAQQRRPGRDDGALLHARTRQSQRRLVQQLKVHRRRFPDAGDGLQLFGGGGEHAVQRAEPRQQRLGQRLDVAAREGAEEVELQQLIVGQRLQPALQRPLAQPLAMAELVALYANIRNPAPHALSVSLPGSAA